MSQSPSRSIATERGGSASSRETLVPGWAARRAARAVGTRVELPLGKDTRRTRAGAQTGDGGDLLLGRGEPGEDAGRVPHQRLARLRQPRLAAAADEQRSADGGFERLHLLADGGLGAAEFASGRREGTGGGDGAQDTEMTGLDHGLSISGAWTGCRISRRRFDPRPPTVPV